MEATTAAATAARENQVSLTGRLTSAPVERELPSGDPLVTFRLSVPRAGAAPTAGSRRAGSDWFDCAVWGGRVRRSALAWAEGDTVTVSGELRRRHFRIDGATRTRVEVEVRAGRRVAAASAPHRRQSGRAAPK